MTDSLIPVQNQGRITLPGSDAPLDVPSGQVVTLQEVIVDHAVPNAATYRFRFIAPAIARDGGGMDFETSIADMQHLCDTYALAQVAAASPAPVADTTPAKLPGTVQVIIAFSDMALPFGQTNPDATQFFMAFSVQDGVCALEPF